MADFSNRVVNEQTIPFLSILDLDGQLYDLKDTKARAAITAIEKTIEDNEKTTSAALNDLQTNKANKSDLATVATSGSYNDLTNTPDLTPYATKSELDTKLNDVLGINADGVSAFVNATKDNDAATGILQEIAKKVDASSQSTDTIKDHTFTYADEKLTISTVNKSVVVPATVTPVTP